jgi:hypothetical protein
MSHEAQRKVAVLHRRMLGPIFRVTFDQKNAQEKKTTGTCIFVRDKCDLPVFMLSRS